ncbi:MAG: hypothetical protein KatS3mg102_0136 [Planctomycetota bacterium]|nr:MAG: hypothetical protein KatS3mg102_0136 [Planctomycetota bacterium]
MLGTALLAVVIAPPALAQPPAAPEPLRLRVLCLYDGTEGTGPARGPLHEMLELPANHLGLRFDYHDVARGLPDDAAMERYRGIATWFADGALPGAERYLRWLVRQLAAGRRALVIGQLGAAVEASTGEPVDPALLAAAYRALGLLYTPASTENPLLIELQHAVEPLVAFERRLEGELHWFDGLAASAPGSQVLLRLRRRDRRDVRCDAVVITPRGGFVAPGYEIWVDPEPPHGAQWRVDPWALLGAAFALQGLPRPDPTTRTGARLAYAQIDGDGFASPSLAVPGQMCARVIYERILRPFAFPTTVGLIAAPLDPDGPAFAGQPELELARAIFALPHVEPATHTYSHPFDWQQGNRAFAAPWAGHDPVAEVERSVQVLERHICPPGREVRAVLWSGAANPPAAAVAAAARLGLPNLGGGLTRRDAAQPSASELRPYARWAGEHLQVHAATANESDFTGGWRGPFDGFRHVTQTWEWTGAPRRTHAVALYYHFYSGEHRASLAALEHAIAWLRGHMHELFPVPASQYARTVEGFVGAELYRLPDGGWSIRNRGALATLRFDGERRHVDLERSRGVLGFAHQRGALYVHLDERTAEPVVYLSESAPARPWLELATVPVYALRCEERSELELEIEGAPWCRLVLAGLRPQASYEIIVRAARSPADSAPPARAFARAADAHGRLELAPAGRGRLVLQLALSPRQGESR